LERVGGLRNNLQHVGSEKAPWCAQTLPRVTVRTALKICIFGDIVYCEPRCCDGNFRRACVESGSHESESIPLARPRRIKFPLSGNPRGSTPSALYIGTHKSEYTPLPELVVRSPETDYLLEDLNFPCVSKHPFSSPTPFYAVSLECVHSSKGSPAFSILIHSDRMERRLKLMRSLASWKLSRLHHRRVLFLEALAQSLRPLQKLVDASHYASFFS